MELTRKQVIEILEKADSTVYKESKTKTAQALEYAIASLETDEAYQLEYERTTKNDLGFDCISRADAIQAMQDKAKKLTNKDTINGLCGAVAILFDLPSVTPIRPKGHWIVREDNTSFVKQIPRRWVECSYCGWSFSYDRIKDDFCSRCGADMRGEE